MRILLLYVTNLFNCNNQLHEKELHSISFMLQIRLMNRIQNIPYLSFLICIFVKWYDLLSFVRVLALEFLTIKPVLVTWQLT